MFRRHNFRVITSYSIHYTKLYDTDSPEKRAAGIAAAGLVSSGMVVGLGTGSTVAYTIKELGRRVREEGLDILGVVTSYQSEMLAIEAGIRLTALAQHPELDLAIDGADRNNFV